MNWRVRTSGELLLVLALAGCGGSGSDPVALADLPARAADTLCAASVRCGVFPDMASCRASLVFDTAQLEADVAAGKIMYDAAQAGACLDETARTLGSCRQSDPRLRSPAACAKTFVGTVATSGACLLNEDCASANCRFPTCASGTCCVGACDTPAVPDDGSVAVGGPCVFSNQCVAGTFCDFSLGSPACVPVKPAGQPCASSTECVSGTACLPNGDTATAARTCVKPPGRGETCAGSSNCDFSGDVCDPVSMTCVARLPVGGSCASKADACILYASCDPTTGLCVARSGVGAACDASTRPCLLGLTCSNGLCAAQPVKPVCAPP